jgi:hypothetical protein
LAKAREAIGSVAAPSAPTTIVRRVRDQPSSSRFAIEILL